jgi:drug/metabolite transporter (DMT)-like permease
LLGLGLGLLAVLAACTGNVLTLTLTRRDLPLVPILAWSMGYGALFLLLLSVISGAGLHFDWRPSYVLSLLYLSVLGTVVAFVLYFKLAQRQGPARAALTGVLIPVIALLISALFEGWQASVLSVAGMALCLGSIYAATRPS